MVFRLADVIRQGAGGAAQLRWSLLLALQMPICAATGFARDHGAPRDVSAIKAIIIHTVGGPICKANQIVFEPIARRADDAAAWRRALRGAPSVEAHFVIGRAGVVEQVMPITEVAFHTKGANDVSIGIELVHRGDGQEAFEPPQIAALVGLIKRLRHKLPGIALNNVVGHDDLDRRTCFCNGAPFRRRQDPGANFPWDIMRAGVRLPSDPPQGKASLAPLDGPAPQEACPVF